MANAWEYIIPRYKNCAVWLRVLLLSIVMCGKAWDPEWFMPMNRLMLRNQVMEMFSHAYNSYMNHAYPADELMPIACKGRIRGVTQSRGDVDDALGNFSLTLIDTLDTLAVLGMYDEFEDAVRKVQNDVKFDADLVVSVFETNIRVLGGLLGGHAVALEIQSQHNRMKWYNGSLLDMAKEVGDRLLPAFNTTTGIPMSRVNLATGAVRKLKDKDTCTACAGTMILEMAALSRFTGDPIYEQKARKAMDYLWSRRQRSSDLMGTVLSVNNGEWIRKESGIGAGIDSYYEYLLKAYILYADEEYLERFNAHYSAIKQYIKQGPMLMDVHMHKPNVNARSFMDALGAFWPGLLVLKGDLVPAIENHELLYQVFQKHKFLPEAFTTSFDIYWGQYPLRPEFAESTYLLYKATKDPYYLEVGKTIVENLEKHARVKCGYAGIKDVRTFKHEDRMDSYFLAEMFKYLYLLFTPDESDPFLESGKIPQPGVNIEKYLLTTEAHLLPLYLSNMAVASNGTPHTPWHSPVNAEGNYERFCPNTKYVRPDDLRPVKRVRQKVKNFFRGIKPVPNSCQGTAWYGEDTSSIANDLTFNGQRKLLASQFDPRNKLHLNLLNGMGIVATILKEGNIQLVQTPSSAVTSQDAKEGEIFLHEILDLNRKRIDRKTVLVQLLSQPYLGAMILKGGPAEFGPNFDTRELVTGTLEYAIPNQACTVLENAKDVAGKIVIAKRGDCAFVEKTKNIENAGGIAAIIIDNQVASQFDDSAAEKFVMAGDHKTVTDIPAVFLYSKEGNILRTCIDAGEAEQRLPLEILIGTEAKSLEEIIIEQQLKRAKIPKKLPQETEDSKDMEISIEFSSGTHDDSKIDFQNPLSDDNIEEIANAVVNKILDIDVDKTVADAPSEAQSKENKNTLDSASETRRTQNNDDKVKYEEWTNSKTNDEL